MFNRFILVILGSLLFTSCSTQEQNSKTAEGVFKIAEDLEKGDRYEEAIRKYNEVKNKFPYSSLATKAELAVADVHFKQESFAEAQISYQNFLELHPKHPQSDYVQFRIGLSLYKQLPSGVDRDLSLADETILAFTQVIKTFPDSTYIPEAKEKRKETIKMLAEKEKYIADFYFREKKYKSALSRYENIINQYDGFGFEESSLARASFCALRINDLDSARRFNIKLKEQFPNSKELKKLDEEGAL